MGLPDVGEMLAAILKAIADAPAYVVCVALGLVLIFFGTAPLGVEYHIGSMCISLGNGRGAPFTAAPSVLPRRPTGLQADTAEALGKHASEMAAKAVPW